MNAQAPTVRACSQRPREAGDPSSSTRKAGLTEADPAGATGTMYLLIVTLY